MKTRMTEQEAIELAKSGFWQDMDHETRFRFQINEQRLCMPFDVFQQAAEETLGRSVWTHEFAKPELLWKEYAGERSRPTMQEIIDMIPTEKRLLIVGPSQ